MMNREEFIKKYKLENFKECVKQDKEEHILYVLHVTDDVELCYWVTKDYELEEINFQIWKDGNCLYDLELSEEDALKIRNKF